MCTTCHDRSGVIVLTPDGKRLARCPVCGGRHVDEIDPVAETAITVRRDRADRAGRSAG
jgi:hypothetical protein